MRVTGEAMVSYPCPKCGEHRLVYDGMLVWRSGPRPPRRLARKQVGFSPRADVERDYCYHCEHCGAEFSNWDAGGIRLRKEGVSGEYTYNAGEGSWELGYFDTVERKWKVKVFDPVKREWVVRLLETQDGEGG
jgi:DNA-directed RNA polymerase subunit RPC12/RpoP